MGIERAALFSKAGAGTTKTIAATKEDEASWQQDSVQFSKLESPWLQSIGACCLADGIGDPFLPAECPWPIGCAAHSVPSQQPMPFVCNAAAHNGDHSNTAANRHSQPEKIRVRFAANEL